MCNRSLLLAVFFASITAAAQPPKPDDYTLDNVDLPAEMDKQVCISGMKYFEGKLYFASERCPKIIVFDAGSRKITNTISLQVPQNFEMEGMTSYKGSLYLISENIAAVYQVNPSSGEIKIISTSNTLPPKSKDGDGMEGIAASEKYKKFYLLRERNDNQTASQVYTYSVEANNTLKFESMIELPLQNPQWRYSDICVDEENGRLLCLKSYAKGKFRQQYLEAIDIDGDGKLKPSTLKNIPVDNFTDASQAYKTQRYSMNLEGITVDNNGTIYIISDNTSGKANCEMEAKEKTILLELKKK